MENFLKINVKPDAEDNIHFIVNKTKKNYVNLLGFNSDDVIDCVHQFMCTYGIWNEEDRVVKTMRKFNFIPSSYHNISFVISFYNKARASKEYNEQMHHNNDEHDEFNDESGLNILMPQRDVPHITVKHLTNPNISHDTKPSNNKSNKETSKSTTHTNKDNKFYGSGPEHSDSDNSDSLDDVATLLDSDDKSDSDVDLKPGKKNNKSNKDTKPYKKDTKPNKKDDKSAKKSVQTVNIKIDSKASKKPSKKNKSESENSDLSNDESEATDSIYSGSDISGGSDLSDEDMDDMDDLDSNDSDIEVNLKVKKNTKKTFPKPNPKQSSKAKPAPKTKKPVAKNGFTKTTGKAPGKKTGGKKGK